MSGFRREDRYIVVKLSKLKERLGHPLCDVFSQLVREEAAGALVDCVVVERDWPEYEIVWQMIEDRITGKPNLIKALKQQRDEQFTQHSITIRKFEECEKQRDELLLVLEKIVPHLSGSWQQEIKAAIAKAGV